MCDTKPTTVQQAKADFYEAKQALRETIQRGDDTFCEYLKHILSPKNSYKTPTDGKQKNKSK